MRNKKSKCAIEFNSAKDATEFSENNYMDFAKTLTIEEKSHIGMIQASGKTVNDKLFINDIMRIFPKCPVVPYDIIAYRAGEMKFKDRPYISATLLKDTAEFYRGDIHKSELHKIKIRKGSTIFPLIVLSKDFGESEAEIIIETKYLRKRKNYYVYKPRFRFFIHRKRG